MLLQKVCLLNSSRNILKVTRLFRDNLFKKHNWQCLHVSTVSASVLRKNKETSFIAQFVPDYSKHEQVNPDRIELKFENDYSKKSLSEVLNAFEDLSFYCLKNERLVTDPEFEPIVNAVSANLKNMTDDEILKILIDLTRFPGIPCGEPKYHAFWSQIDDQCWERSKYWKWPMLLKVMNVFYKLAINQNSTFCHKALMKLSRKTELLPPRILVEMMFYQSVIRHKDVPMHNIETRLSQIINDLTIDEIGIICLAFFKTESKILSHELLSKIYDRLNEELNDIADITLANILKIFRYSSKPSLCEQMNEFFIRVIPLIDKFSLLCCLHIALLGTNLQNLNQELIELIVQRFNKEVSTVRLKDLERITLVIALYDLKTKSGIENEFMKNVVDELKKRVDEIVLFPRCYTSTLHYLSIKGVHDIELLQAALKEKFIVFAYGKNYFSYSRDILSLDSYTRINLKGKYEGPQLTDKIRRGISTYSSHYIPYVGQPHKLTHADKVLLDVHVLSKKMFGKNIITQALPHFEKPDIIYCFDENEKSVTDEIIDLFPPRKIHPGIIFTKEHLLSQKKPFSENIDKYKLVALVIGGWNFYIRDTEIPTGIMRMKVEQLKMIGYNPVMIYWKEWINKSLHLREEYLNRKFKEALSQ